MPGLVVATNHYQLDVVFSVFPGKIQNFRVESEDLDSGSGECDQCPGADLPVSCTPGAHHGFAQWIDA